MLITKKELAEKLNVCLMTVNRMMARGMPYLKIGKSVRFDFEKVMTWFKENQK